MSCDISVIIPVYNGERYIRKCIDSVIKQEKIQIECIVIDDCSTDGTKSILSNYRDDRIRVVYNDERKGVSYSRNVGINLAEGKYISFVDSDDIVKSKTYNVVMKECLKEKLDVAIYPMAIFVNNEVKKLEFRDRGLCNNFIYYPEYMNSVCNKLFKRELIIKNNIKFDEELPVEEDFIFSFESLIKAKNIKYVTKGMYLYRANNQSMTSKGYKISFVDELKHSCQSLHQICLDNNCEKEFKKLLKEKIVKYSIRYLIYDDIYSLKRYRQENNKKYICTFPRYRLDFTMITFFGNIGLELPIKMYLKLKKAKNSVINNARAN